MKFYQVLTYPAPTLGIYLLPERASTGFLGGFELVVPGIGTTLVLGGLFVFNLFYLRKAVRINLSVLTPLFIAYSMLLIIPYHLLKTAHTEKTPIHTTSVLQHDWKAPPRDVQLLVYEGEKTARHFFAIGSLLFFGCSLFWYSSGSNKLSILLYPLHLLCGYYLFLNYS